MNTQLNFLSVQASTAHFIFQKWWKTLALSWWHQKQGRWFTVPIIEPPLHAINFIVNWSVIVSVFLRSWKLHTTFLRPITYFLFRGLPRRRFASHSRHVDENCVIIKTRSYSRWRFGGECFIWFLWYEAHASDRIVPNGSSGCSSNSAGHSIPQLVQCMRQWRSSSI